MFGKIQARPTPIMRILVYFILVILPLQGTCQTFADPEFYLLDSLDLEAIKSSEKQRLDSCLTVFHSEQHDTIRIGALSYFIEECWDDAVWPRYNSWLSVYLEEIVVRSSYDIQTVSRIKVLWALSLNNLGYYYWRQGDIPKALEYYGRSLKLNEELGYKKGIAMSLNNIGAVCADQDDYAKAIDYHTRSLKIKEEIGDKQGIAMSLNNIGIIYNEQSDYAQAIDYYTRSLKIREKLGDKIGIATSLHSIGIVSLEKLGDIPKALEYFGRSLKLHEEIGDKSLIAPILTNIGEIHIRQQDYPKAEKYLKRSMDMSRELGFSWSIGNAAEKLSKLYRATGKHELALENYELHIQMRDSINNIESQTAIIKQLTKYEYEKMALADSLEFIKKEAVTALELEKQETKVRGQRIVMGSMGLGLALILALAFSIHRGKQRSDVLRKQSDDLLLNILPEETAKELKQKGYADAQQFDQVTVLFTDFKGFTQISERLSPKDLVAAIDECFKAFDEIMGKYGIEKIKTIGDAYMAAGGLPVPNTSNPESVVKAGIEMRDWMLKYRDRVGENGFEVRVGIHTGPVVAGIVGIKKFAYDIWGDTVNTASRMESSGEAGKVNISHTTYELVKDQFACDYRGEIEAKGKGKVKMYFVEEA
jgi:class 3 adenylate cyclase/tetratricopeptide (TPR) repeat protein